MTVETSVEEGLRRRPRVRAGGYSVSGVPPRAGKPQRSGGWLVVNGEAFGRTNAVAACRGQGLPSRLLRIGGRVRVVSDISNRPTLNYSSNRLVNST